MSTDEESNRLVTVERFLHPTEAHIAAGRLESEGIPVNLLGINHASANWLIINALGGIRLQVPSQFAEDARSILEIEARVGEGGPDTERCPFCGSSNATSHSTAWKISLLAVHVFSIPIPWGRGRRQCMDCKNTWESGVT
jgi:hypothetical protein